MAQKRMLNKSISLSSQVNKLNLKEKLIFTWAIPHLDDCGLIENNPEVLKAMICPMVQEINIQDIQQFIKKTIEVGLIKEYQDCLEFLGFENHQSISANKRAKSKFQKIPKNPQENSGKSKNPQENSGKSKNPQENSGKSKNPQKSPVEDNINNNNINNNNINNINNNITSSFTNVKEEEQAPVLKKFRKKEIDQIFEKFKSYGLNITKQRLNRFAAYRLVEKFGLEKTFKMIEAAMNIQGKPYAPTIKNPMDLEEKLLNLRNYFEIQKNKKQIKIIKI